MSFDKNRRLDDAEAERRSIRFFSQSGEDCFLWMLLDFPQRGVFIDVGAFDGKYLSNSLSFAEREWKVICVEPLKQFADLCSKNQPGSICVNAACVADETINSITFASEPLGIYSRLDPQEGDLAELQDFYEKRGSHLEDFTRVEVPATTLWKIACEHLAENEAVDVLSIDVEGSEIAVLSGANLSMLRPRVICAEANSDDAANALDKFLADFGYVYLRTMAVNRFYSNEPALIERAKTLHVRCVIERHSHPLGLRYTIPEILSGHIIDELSVKARRQLGENVRALRSLGKLAGATEVADETPEAIARSVERHISILSEGLAQEKKWSVSALRSLGKLAGVKGGADETPEAIARSIERRISTLSKNLAQEKKRTELALQTITQILDGPVLNNVENACNGLGRRLSQLGDAISRAQLRLQVDSQRLQKYPGITRQVFLPDFLNSVPATRPHQKPRPRKNSASGNVVCLVGLDISAVNALAKSLGASNITTRNLGGFDPAAQIDQACESLKAGEKVIAVLTPPPSGWRRAWPFRIGCIPKWLFFHASIEGLGEYVLVVSKERAANSPASIFSTLEMRDSSCSTKLSIPSLVRNINQLGLLNSAPPAFSDPDSMIKKIHKQLVAREQKQFPHQAQ